MDNLPEGARQLVIIDVQEQGLTKDEVGSLRGKIWIGLDKISGFQGLVIIEDDLPKAK